MSTKALQAAGETDVIPADTSPTAHPLAIFAEEMRKGMTIEKMQEMRSFVEWWEKREAEKAFNADMTKFRQESITILKNAHVKFKNRTGGWTEYDHETLDLVVEIVSPFLGKHGFSHRWERCPAPEKEIGVKCIITHAMGHRIETDLSGPPDESGGKNTIQGIASTVHYLERYTFLMLTGLAAKGKDTDGRTPTASSDPDAISEAQATILQKLIKDTGTKLDSFLDFAKIEKVEDLPAARFAECKDMLERRKAHQQQKGSTK